VSNLAQSKRSAASEVGRVALALAVVAAAYLVRLWLHQQFGFSLSIYLVYVTAILIDAILLGLWPGLAATVAAALLVDYAVMKPEGSFGVKNPAHFAALLLSAVICAGVCILAERFRHSQRRVGKLESVQALNEARIRFEAAIESSAEAMFLCDTEGNLVEFNQAFAAFHRFQSKSEVPRNVHEYPSFIDVSFPDGSPAPPEQWVVPRAMRGEHATGAEYQQRRRDTGEMWICSFNFAPIRAEDGKIVGCVVSALDITERKKAEEALRLTEARYRAAFETSLDIMVIASLPDCRSIDVNPRFTEEFGYSREEAIGKTSAELGMWPHEQDHERLVQSFRDEKPYRDVCVEFRKRDGSTLWGLASASRLQIDGKPCILVSVRNITNERNAEEAQRLSEARYRAAFETSPDVIVISRFSDGAYLDVNPTFTEVTGWQREEVIGKTAREIDVWVDYANRDAMMEVIRKGQTFRGVEIQFRRKDGSTMWSNVYATTIQLEGEPCLLVQVRDITQEKRAEEEIRTLAFYDQVTGLANRRLLAEQFRKSIAMSSRTHRKRALLFLDLDNFKNLNDTRGHHTGDLLLHEVGRRLSECVSPLDTVSRLGGDEFVLILEELHGYSEVAATQAMETAERILQSLRQPYLIDRIECRTSCSIGITVFGEDQQDFNHVLQQADIAMYQAKAAGRGTMRFFAPGLQAAVTARATLEEEIRAGIEHRQFVLYFQPQFQLGRLHGAEALVRWQHPQRGLLLPGDFIPLAEETRLILPMGAWVLETACRKITEWAERYPGANLTVAVNVSALELHREDFVDSVLDTVKRTGANPRWLKLELTESMLVENAEDAAEKMTALKRHGIRFAIDDFGTGYSSLAYLKRLPLSLLKIDRSFVRDILTDSSSDAIVRTIIALSRSLGLRVMSEGVETAGQRAALEDLGCHAHQGYLFGPPLPVEEFERILAAYSGDPALVSA
jgi:diguanylate cyclase (GGDEF)-like protein/PAS domain S-box-containing protein